jgi:hypothetical protein
MSPTTSPPSMSHSPAYYHNGAHISTAPIGGDGVSSSHIQQPPRAHLYQERRSLLPAAAGPASQRPREPARVVSPLLSDVAKHSSQPTSPHSSDADRGLNSHSHNRRSTRPSGRDGTVPSQGSPWPNRGSAEYTATVYPYPTGGDGVERVADHAVLVLVSRNQEFCTDGQLTCSTALARLL